MEFINTIKYYDENGKKNSLTEKEREILFEFFFEGKNFKFEDIKIQLNKQLGNKTKYNYPIDKKTGVYETSISGMPICKGLIDIFGDNIKKFIN